VQTASPIDIGMRCALAFPLPGREGKVHVIGRVVRTVRPEFTANQSLRVPGMGVEFERFSGRTDRRAIEGWVHRHEDQTQRPETRPLSIT
jgi:Tfp pilus assembly protein PilZ